MKDLIKYASNLNLQIEQAISNKSVKCHRGMKKLITEEFLEKDIPVQLGDPLDVTQKALKLLKNNKSD